jgi:uncharacterized membrane protein YgdD (TMEM256/DUF423 family)
MGAFGAHALKELLKRRDTAQVRHTLAAAARAAAIHANPPPPPFQSWSTATQYQILHSVALLSLHAASKQGAASSQYDLAAKLWISGTVLFSGSIYGLSVGGPRLLGPVTPLGGLLLMAGWVAFGVAAGSSA